MIPHLIANLRKESTVLRLVYLKNNWRFISVLEERTNLVEEFQLMRTIHSSEKCIQISLKLIF